MRDLLGRATLRARVTVVATVLATVVLAVAGALLVTLLGDALRAEVTTAALVRSQDLAALAATGALPEPVATVDADELLVQVVADGVVVGGTAGPSERAPIDGPAPPVGTSATSRRERIPGLEDEDDAGFVLAATTVDVDGVATTVYVASSLEDAVETATAARRIGVVALPVLAVVLGVGVWLVVGRTLAPVESLRAEADAIEGSDLHRRLPAPTGHDEVASLGRTLNRMLDRIEESQQRERRFVADSAHELRTPIASMRANLETARGSGRAVDWSRVSAEVLADVVRMQRLTEQLLLLARADAGRLVAQMTPLDLDEVVASAVTASRDGDADVLVDVELHPVRTTGDAVLLEHAVGELVDNATRHARSRVLVTIDEHDGRATVTVDDDGSGIAPDRREDALRRFVRLDESRARRGGGAGLGLAIVADIAAAHGGALVVERSPMGGARTRLSLPAG